LLLGLRTVKLLCVLPCVPFPSNTGGTLRTFHLLRALDAVFDVTVLAPDRGGDAEGLRQLLRGRVVVVKRSYRRLRELLGRAHWAARGLPMNYEPYASAEMRTALSAVLEAGSFDVIHFDHLHAAQLLPLARRTAPKARIVVDEHNVEAKVMERMIPCSPLEVRPLLFWHAKRVAALERNVIRAADAVLACSREDEGDLMRRGASRVQVVPNGVDFQWMQVTPAVERRDVVFVGSMDWWPNSDAATRLMKDIWPLAAPKLPGARLAIVGRKPSDSLRQLAAPPDIVVTGTVECVKPHLAKAWATAIPLRAGSGTRLKILEAAAARVPLVTSKLAAEGLPLVDGKHALYAETPLEFAEALIRLNREPRLAANLAEAARTIAQQFDWSAIGAGLVRFYQSELRPV
jgi:glycosyltransferase involved in cell wall biosynthesis